MKNILLVTCAAFLSMITAPFSRVSVIPLPAQDLASKTVCPTPSVLPNGLKVPYWPKSSTVYYSFDSSVVEQIFLGQLRML